MELSSLIPLRHSVAKLVLIGDPQQLPATVLSASAKKFNYERSLFQRLQLCGTDVIMLAVQYRMRPEISAFPSKHFYHGRLANDASVVSRSLLPFHSDFPSIFAPLKFFDVPSMETRHHLSQSLCNRTEAAFIVQLLTTLMSRYGPTGANPTLKVDDVAVVTPYRQQVMEIQKLMKERGGTTLLSESSLPLEVCTIDSFQGREKRVIVFSCVRALAGGLEEMTDSPPPADESMIVLSSEEEDDELNNVFGRGRHSAGVKKRRLESPKGRPPAPRPSGGSIGFVADIRRLNVAITRARDSLWVVGNSRTLQGHATWAALINHSKSIDTDSFDACPFVDVAKATEQMRQEPGLLQEARAHARHYQTFSSPLLDAFFNLTDRRQARRALPPICPPPVAPQPAHHSVFSSPRPQPQQMQPIAPQSRLSQAQMSQAQMSQAHITQPPFFLQQAPQQQSRGGRLPPGEQRAVMMMSGPEQGRAVTRQISNMMIGVAPPPWAKTFQTPRPPR